VTFGFLPVPYGQRKVGVERRAVRALRLISESSNAVEKCKLYVRSRFSAFARRIGLDPLSLGFSA